MNYRLNFKELTIELKNSKQNDNGYFIHSYL